MKVGLVTDAGTINDPGIDQDAWTGVLDAAQRLGTIAPVALHSATTKLISTNIQSLIDQGTNVIVTVGYAGDEWTLGYAVSNPDVQFIGVDQGLCVSPEGVRDETGTCAGNLGELAPNLQVLLWKQQDAGYLAGIVAASVSKTGHILTVGRAESPSLTNYMVGYLNGATSVDAGVKVDLAYMSTAADEWDDSYDQAAGKAFTDQLLEASPDIDVVFQAAGGEYAAGGYEATRLGSTATGILESACDHGAYAIGMAIDQHMALASNPSASKCLITSAQTFFAKGVSDAIVRVAESKSVGGNTRLDMSTGSAGLAPFYGFASLITADTQAAITAAIAGLASGAIHACAQDSGGACIKASTAR